MPRPQSLHLPEWPEPDAAGFFVFTAGQLAPCPGPRDHLGRRTELRDGEERRRAARCGRAIYIRVGRGRVVRVRELRKREKNERWTAESEGDVRFCPDCEFYIEVRSEPQVEQVA
jgi:hypothetical protein